MLSLEGGRGSRRSRGAEYDGDSPVALEMLEPEADVAGEWAWGRKWGDGSECHLTPRGTEPAAGVQEKTWVCRRGQGPVQGLLA